MKIIDFKNNPFLLKKNELYIIFYIADNTIEWIFFICLNYMNIYVFQKGGVSETYTLFYTI